MEWHTMVSEGQDKGDPRKTNEEGRWAFCPRQGRCKGKSSVVLRRGEERWAVKSG